MFAPVPLVDRHRKAGELRNIIPRECHIVFIVHLQSAHDIVFCEAVYILFTHIIVGTEQLERITPQLVFVNPTLHGIDCQRHDSIKAVTHPDLPADPVKPPIIEISFHCPATPFFMADYSPVIPLRIFFLCFSQRQAALLHDSLDPLPLPIGIRDKFQQWV